MYKRDVAFDLVKEGLAKSYKIKDFTAEEYEDLRHRCRKFKVEQIMSREERDDVLEGSKWSFRVQVRDQFVFVNYVTPEDMVIRVLLKEHFTRHYEDEPEPPVKKASRVIKEAIDKEVMNDLLKDLAEVGIDEAIS